MIYVYGIVDAAAPGLEVAGHEEAPLRALPAPDGALAGVFSEHAESVGASEDALWRHEEVVERLMRAHAVLPMRFGTMLAGPEALAEVLEREHGAFAGGLEHVRGRVELGVRVLWDPPPSPPGREGTSGSAYLRARLEARQEAEAAIDAVHGPLRPLAADARLRRHVTPRMLLNGAYLVERDAVEAFAAAVRRVDEANAALTLLSTGPWPPYSFVPQGAEASPVAAA